MSVVRVVLMASAAGKIGAVTWHHLFLVAADASGTLEYLRAGPQCLPVERLVGRMNQYGEALEDYEPPPGGPYGLITFSSGAYEAGGVDFDPAAASVTLASGPVAAELWEKVRKAAEDLQGDAIPYDPIGKGANWALMEVLRRCGVEASPPPGRWAPGVSLVTLDPAVQSASTRRVGEAVVI